ncbi:flagellar M-ring protein FliF [Paralcaligenes sp. KSB-10]|uniref:flagellar basal-body MS-ring/collar protein FliF n=1 Tax=Paralcaligenes sp. KSB-10 TaxID=2901142 RepID=UPI001E4AFE20|nr:flagellar basal-body MS-ring/collar protein FliF [Paralcaligenes sp. KSB-10]UHL65292.1 flagellar M-ring protein FliF [Paralcaligenes sp. KSB-10]
MSSQAAFLARFPALAKLGNWPKSLQICAAAAVVALIVALLLWSRTPDYRVLFSNLADQDGGAIVTALGQMNVPYKFSDNGSALLVPADKVYQTRLQLASQGLPRGGKVGFELLDHTQFGASQFTEQITYQRALEGELASSIEAVHSVKQARVHLAIPRESLFVRERQSPTASVLITLYPGRSLNESQVAAITWLVSSSVPNLTADKVSIVDQNGRLLTAPSGQAGADGTRRAFTSEVEEHTVQRILTLLTPLVGANNVRAQASADIDFSQREQTSEVYRPNQKPGEAAVRSEQTSSSARHGLLPPEGVPGALTNQPPANATAPITRPNVPAVRAPAAAAAPGAAPGAVANATTPATEANQSNQPGDSRHDATVNYEVDRTINHVKHSVGTMQRLSVAVVVNYQRNAAGKLVPLDPGEMAKLNNLVKEAMGYSAARGDTLSVVNSPFNTEDPDKLAIWENPTYQALALRLGQYLLIALIIFMLWRSLLKPLLAGITSSGMPPAAPMTSAASAAAESEAAAAQRDSEINRYEENLATARRMAERDPRAVAMVLRSWMGNNGSN